MNLSVLEIFALTLIAFSAIKISVILINPTGWTAFARKLYINPQVTSVVALVLGMIVLYYLIDSGITIVQILAVCLFLVFLIAIGIAKYARDIIDWANERDLKSLMKEQWLYALIWVLLLGWGLLSILLG